MRKTLVILALTALLGTSPAKAGMQRKEPSHRFALIAVTSADQSTALADVLRLHYGYDPKNVRVLGRTDATSRNLQAAMGKLAGETAPSDSVLLHLEAATTGEGIDTAYLVAGAVPGERWTHVTILDVAKAVYSLRATTVLLVFPMCISPKSSVQDTLGPLFTQPGKNISLVTYCARGDASGTLASHIARVLQGDRAGDVPFGVDEIGELIHASAPFDVRTWTPPASTGEPFVFLPTRGRLSSYTAILASSAAETKLKEVAIQELVQSLLSEPAERRSALLSNTGVLQQLAASASGAPTLRLKAIWAMGEIQHPAAATTFETIYSSAPADASLRRAAVEAAAKLPADGGVKLLRTALSDAEATVKVVAVRNLGVRRDEPSRSTLVAMVQNDANADVRIAALQSLSLFTDPDGSLKTAIAALLEDPSPAVRREAVATWIALGGVAATGPLVAKLGVDTDATVRQTIAYALGRKTPPAEALDRVVGALRTAAATANPPIVREAAIWSLGELGTAAEQSLLAVVNNQKDDPKIIAAAAQALGKQKSRRAVKALLDLLRSSDVQIATSAASALGDIGDSSTRVISALFDAARTGDTFLRAKAEKALQNLSPKRIDLVPLLRDKSPVVRREAATKIASAKDPNDVQLLALLLSDPDPTVREEVLGWLSQYEDDAARQRIGSMISDEDPFRREAAARLIGMWRWPGGTSALLSGASDADPRVRAQSVQSLGRLAAPATAKKVLEATTDRDPLVRRAAAEALSAFSSSQAAAALQRMSEDPNPEVRQAAIDVLRKKQ